MTGHHYLVVEPFDPEGEPGDLFDVEHPADCPVAIVDYDEHGKPYEEYRCAVAYHLDAVPVTEWFRHVDDPCPADSHAPAVSRGRHAIEAWSRRTGGSCGLPVEWDGGLGFAAEVAL